MERKSQKSKVEGLPAGELNAGFASKVEAAQSLQELFELAKEAVWKKLKVEQAGLMVGLAEMGIGHGQVLGAYYSPEANAIVINRTITDSISRLDKRLYNSYCFYILLHEYLHSCGFYDERENRIIVAAIAISEFGLHHPVTKLATTDEAMLQLISLARPQAGSISPGIEFLEGIDRSNTDYIM